MSGYRKLVIKGVMPEEEHVQILCFESLAVLRFEKKWLLEHDVDPESLVEGRQILVKGKKGNDDFFLLEGIEELLVSDMESEKAVAKAQMDVVNFIELFKALNQSELFRYTTLEIRSLKVGNLLEVKLETEKIAGFLLKSSLNDGMLRNWRNYFSFVK